ncbi:hypothetical protein TWF481_010463 [Arthrobotrys musiformis]|uniref:NACHT domain-containing protein n=1 Tax=Arthrobotrys musiformis TaxID=47236 RepID=A0AAV9W277_9PEZI
MYLEDVFFIVDDDEKVGREGYELVQRVAYETERVTNTVKMFKKRIEETKTRIFSFFETHMTPKVIKLSDESYGRYGDPVILVTRDSVELGISDLEELLSAPANHSTIVKFKSEQDPTYRTVHDRLKDIIQSAEAAAIRGPTKRKLPPTLQDNQRKMISEIRKQIPSAPNAAFDSYKDDGLDAKCHPGTRTELLCEVREWAKDPDGPYIYWLRGMAGTGKSTIARTLAQNFEEDGLLGASFFFKRGESDRGNASRLFTTIATQFLSRIPDLIPHIRTAIDEEPEIATKSLEKQFDRLILYPLEKLSQVSLSVVLVLDALDECEGDHIIRKVIYLLAKVQALKTVHIRIFLTSRPELPTRLGFGNISSDIYKDIKLHDVPPAIIEHDISLFLTAKFSAMRDDFNKSTTRVLLPPEWPGADVIQKLTSTAIPLFIFAATICRFVGDMVEWDPETRLATVLKYGVVGASQLDQTYLPVLERLEGDVPKQKLRRCLFGQEFREIIGSIVILADPLSILSLASLLGKSQNEISNKLHHLHSVLNIPKDTNAPVRPLHLSFREFLIDPEKEDSDLWFWINEKETHSAIAKRSLINNEGPEALRFLHDAKRFLLQSWRIVDQAPLQLYSSAIIFSPETSIIKARFRNHIPREICMLPKVQQFWGAELQTLEHEGTVAAIAFSPDGAWLVLGSDDGIIIVWNAVTGEEVKRLKGYNLICVIAFSSDSTRLASALGDGIIILWDIITGKEIKQLTGHDEVTAVTFSSDGTQLISMSRDGIITFWNTTTGEEVKRSKGYSEWTGAVAFSPDGTQLVSGSVNGIIIFWDVATGEEVKQLKVNQNHLVGAIAFSPNGELLALASISGTIELWDIEGGLKRLSMERHGWIDAVAFSHDGTRLALGLDGGIIRLWDMEGGGGTIGRRWQAGLDGCFLP